jgi:hypothetical protein
MWYNPTNATISFANILVCGNGYIPAFGEAAQDGMTVGRLLEIMEILFRAYWYTDNGYLKFKTPKDFNVTTLDARVEFAHKDVQVYNYKMKPIIERIQFHKNNYINGVGTVYKTYPAGSVFTVNSNDGGVSSIIEFYDPHLFVDGDTLTVSGATNAGYNGSHINIYVIDSKKLLLEVAYVPEVPSNWLCTAASKGCPEFLADNVVKYNRRCENENKYDVSEICTSLYKLPLSEDYSTDGYFFAYVNPADNNILMALGYRNPSAYAHNNALSQSKLMVDNYSDYIFTEYDNYTNCTLAGSVPIRIKNFLELPDIEKIISPNQFYDSLVYKSDANYYYIARVKEQRTNLLTNITTFKSYAFTKQAI